MLHKSFLGLLLAPLLVLLAGCCANNPCDCNDSLADSLFFAFEPSFTKTELDTVYISRRSIANPTQAPDSLPLPIITRRPTTLTAQIDSGNQRLYGLVVISNNAPFSQTTTNGNLSRYTYRLSIPRDAPAGSPRTFYTYRISDIKLTGSYLANGCCTCYRNSLKLVRVTGGSNSNLVQTVTDDGAASSGRRTPMVITLLK